MEYQDLLDAVESPIYCAGFDKFYSFDRLVANNDGIDLLYKYFETVCDRQDTHVLFCLLQYYVNDDTTFENAKEVMERYHNLIDLKEWRPWNNNKYPKSYRLCFRNLMLIAKV